MARLKLEITQNLTEVLEISEQPLTLGRGRENDFVLLDGIVSRCHAKVYREEQDILIEDLNSANGTFVNGSRIMLRALQEGDLIQMGKARLFFSSESIEEAPMVVDLMKNPFSVYDYNTIVLARDILFRFPSDDDTIQKIYETLQQMFELLETSEIEKTNLYMALNEGVGNAQRHGHRYQADLPIELRYIRKQDKVIMRVTDQGDGFDYRSELSSKKQMSPIEAARARILENGYGNLGIMLMLRCVDEVDYNRKGNQVTLTKFLSKPESEKNQQKSVLIEDSAES